MWDIIPIFAGIVLALLPFLFLPEHGENIYVVHESQTLFSAELPLDTTLTVMGDCGRTVIKIDGYRADVLEANCPKKLCVKTGEISRPGSAIICVPGKIAVIIEGKSDQDAITR